MISSDYLLDKPKGPGPAKVFLDQKVAPAIINAAGTVESGLEAVLVHVRKSPVAALGIALGTGTLLTMLTVPRRA